MVISFFIPDGATVICDVVSNIDVYGVSRNVTPTGMGNFQTYAGGIDIGGNFYASGDPLSHSNLEVSIQRSGASLIYTMPDFYTLGVGGIAIPWGTDALQGAYGFSSQAYTGTLVVDENGIVTGSVPAWAGQQDSEITFDYLSTNYDYKISGYGFQRTSLVFENMHMDGSGNLESLAPIISGRGPMDLSGAGNIEQQASIILGRGIRRVVTIDPSILRGVGRGTFKGIL